MNNLLKNLVVNAIKLVTCGNLDKSICERSGSYWKFAVADNGIGIDKAHGERIFVIFQRLHTRSQYPGSGIGLSLCKKIVELHNCKIRVESIPGEGSIFHFTIPNAI